MNRRMGLYNPQNQKPRWGLIVLIVLFHVLVLVGLARALAPDFTARVIADAGSLITVTITAPQEPEVPPAPDPDPLPDEGAAGEQGEKAIAKEVIAVKPVIPPPKPQPAPKAASTGTQNNSGAKEQGDGTGAGGPGDGTGSGRRGNGYGGLPVTKPILISGNINAARDYPIPNGGRQARRGTHVDVYMTVTVDGRATQCYVRVASPDAEADRITCQLAEERFRFKPARNVIGDPVPSTYGWRQEWFAKGSR